MPRDSALPAISIIVPAYNEESVIVATLRDIVRYCKKKFSSFEIIVVDDASSDGTADLVEQIAGVTLLHNAFNRGKGYSVRRGVLASTGKLFLFMDADNSTNISELNHCLEEIRRFDLVVGSRALNASRVQVSQPRFKRWSGVLGNRLVRSVLGLRINDTQCGFKLFRGSVRPLFKKQRIERWGFDFEILYLAKRAGFSIYESPVTWVNSFASKVRPVDYLLTIADLLRIRIWEVFGKYR